MGPRGGECRIEKIPFRLIQSQTKRNEFASRSSNSARRRAPSEIWECQANTPRRVMRTNGIAWSQAKSAQRTSILPLRVVDRAFRHRRARSAHRAVRRVTLPFLDQLSADGARLGACED